MLFVDDDELIRDGMSRALKRHFISYYDAPNGEDALEIFHRHRPDIVVADVTMPVMDGLELARKIKQEDRDVPVIINSAHNEIVFLADAIEIGIDSYILKPTEIAALLALCLKCAQPILKQRVVESQDKLIRHLLGLANAPTFIACGRNLESANTAFLDFVGYSSEAELQAQFEQMNGRTLNDPSTAQTEQCNCLEPAGNASDILNQVLQLSKNQVDFGNLTRFDMPGTDKSVFTLRQITNSFRASSAP